MPKTTRYPNNLRQYRLKRRLTQQQVLRKLGHSSASRLSAWENGSAQPSARHLVQLADVYNVSVEKLLGRKSKVVRCRMTDLQTPPTKVNEPTTEELIDQLAQILVEAYLIDKSSKR